jgi:cytochrome oxidase Cu insertion factor (SCO1/SenC/PrrC family)
MYKNIIYSFIIVFLCAFTKVTGQDLSNNFKEEENIYEKVFDASLTIKGGEQMDFAALYSKKPVLLALIFTRCGGICNPFLVQLKENLQFKNNSREFNVLVLSFDPYDSRIDMDFLAERLGLENNEQWFFATTDSIDKLTQSVGFYPVWDSLRIQFDHEAMLVGVNTDGYITKKLIGLRNKQDLAQMINSVNNIFSASYRLPAKNQLFSCFNYNPETGKNTPGLGLLFLMLPAILTVLLVIGVSYFAKRTREKTN